MDFAVAGSAADKKIPEFGNLFFVPEGRSFRDLFGPAAPGATAEGLRGGTAACPFYGPHRPADCAGSPKKQGPSASFFRFRAIFAKKLYLC